MSIIDKLASSLNRRDEAPNQELAIQIAANKDKYAIQELVKNLSNKSKDVQNDCIKVLYEIGEINPSLIAPYSNEFVGLLEHKNNRLQWGAMTALSCITPENPEAIYASLPQIVLAAEKGSVITKDYAVNILIQLCSIAQFADSAFLLLNEQLLISPTNQLPMYAEKALPVIDGKNKKLFIETLSSRLDDIEKDTKRKRVEKVIQKVNKS
jgi:HEAT repeat protein